MSTTTTTATTAAQPTLKTFPSPSVPSGPVTVPLNFFVPPADGSPAQYLVDAGPGGHCAENFGTETIPTPLHDIRGSEPSFSRLRDHAFAALQHIPSDPAINWDDDASIKSKYYPEVRSLLLSTLAREEEEEGAGQDPTTKRERDVIIFDHTIRIADPQAYRSPVLCAHVDQTAYSTAQRVRRHAPTPDLAEKYLQGRYRIINVWRPLNDGPVRSFPLAFASAPSASAADIQPIQHVYPDGYVGEHAGVKFGAGQKWHYWSGMTPDERLLLQCFDSAVGEAGGRTPHAAFADPRTPPDAEARKSIEVRALVFG